MHAGCSVKRGRLPERPRPAGERPGAAAGCPRPVTAGVMAVAYGCPVAAAAVVCAVSVFLSFFCFLLFLFFVAPLPLACGQGPGRRRRLTPAARTAAAASAGVARSLTQRQASSRPLPDHNTLPPRVEACGHAGAGRANQKVEKIENPTAAEGGTARQRGTPARLRAGAEIDARGRDGERARWRRVAGGRAGEGILRQSEGKRLAGGRSHQRGGAAPPAAARGRTPTKGGVWGRGGFGMPAFISGRSKLQNTWVEVAARRAPHPTAVSTRFSASACPILL